jgi:hypothetical protein
MAKTVAVVRIANRPGTSATTGASPRRRSAKLKMPAIATEAPAMVRVRESIVPHRSMPNASSASESSSENIGSAAASSPPKTSTMGTATISVRSAAESELPTFSTGTSDSEAFTVGGAAHSARGPAEKARASSEAGPSENTFSSAVAKCAKSNRQREEAATSRAISSGLSRTPTKAAVMNIGHKSQVAGAARCQASRPPATRKATRAMPRKRGQPMPSGTPSKQRSAKTPRARASSAMRRALRGARTSFRSAIGPTGRVDSPDCTGRGAPGVPRSSAAV